MSRLLVCPELAQFQEAAFSQLTPAAKEALLEHLENCDICARKFEAFVEQDTLVEMLRHAHTRHDSQLAEKLSHLVERLSQLRPEAENTSPSRIPPPAQALIFRCSGCGTNLKVKQAVAGKKVKCPQCQQHVETPSSTPIVTSDTNLSFAGSANAPAQIESPSLAESRTLGESNAGAKDDDTLAHPHSEDGDLCVFLAPAQAADELGRLGPYRVLKVLGAGGMGVVFRAEDPHLQRLVALKALLPALASSASAKQRFLREARAAAALKHDHIVTIHQVGEDRDTPFLAMEFLQGEPLDVRLQREGRLPLQEILRIGREIAEGLEAAHEHGLVHRDIKPANVWLESRKGKGVRDKDRAPRVKILDFGLARAASEGSQLTQHGSIVGTPAYMAPEQAKGQELDHRCDLFSLGCVLYRMTTGTLPFKGTDAVSTLLAVATEDPPAPATLNTEVPPALSDLVQRLLAKNPADRPPSAHAVVEALAALEHEITATPTPRPVGASIGQARSGDQAAAQSRPRRRVSRMLVAAVLLGVLAGASFLFGPAIYRFATNQGEIIVETDDPKVEVVANQQGVIIHDKDTDRKYALKLGKHNIQSGAYEIDVGDAKSGLRFSVDQFSITRNGQQIVKVWLERPALAKKDGTKPGPADKTSPAPSALKDKAKPFVVVWADGKKREECKDLAEALANFQDGDTIEVHANGPFTPSHIVLTKKRLTLRAGPGYRPRFLSAAIHLSDAALVIDGCDFHSTGEHFLYAAGVSPFEMRNCRLIAMNINRLIQNSGPKLRLENCLIHSTAQINIDPKADVELINNLFFSGAWFFDFTSGGGQKVRLEHNTFALQSGFSFAPTKDSAPVSVTAVGNVFRSAAVGNLTEVWNDRFVWKGERNLYIGPPSVFSDLLLGKVVAPGFDAWSKWWGREIGSRVVEDLPFQLQDVRVQTPEAAIASLRRVTDELRRRRGLADLGPDWDLVGPGEAYVKALAAAGQAVPMQNLRPAAGNRPFLVLRAGELQSGHPNLPDAVKAAASGDTIEIRSDGPIKIGEFGGSGRSLTLRAAPGYLPVLDGHFQSAETWSLEGLHFSTGRIAIAYPEGGKHGLARLANCSFALPDISELYHVHGFGVPGTKPAEIVNCLIPSAVTTGVTRAEVLKVRNSVIGGMLLHTNEDRDSRLEIDRCVLSFGTRSGASLVLIGKRRMAIRAQGTLFDTTNSLTSSSARIAAWTGSHNVYRIGAAYWCYHFGAGEPMATDLSEWRRVWKSEEEGSVADSPLIHDPAQWRLPNAPLAPDGQPFGAKLDRVVRTEQANPPP